MPQTLCLPKPGRGCDKAPSGSHCRCPGPEHPHSSPLPNPPPTRTFHFSFSIFSTFSPLQFSLQKQSVPVMTAGPLCPRRRGAGTELSRSHRFGWVSLLRFVFLPPPPIFFSFSIFVNKTKQTKKINPNPAQFWGEYWLGGGGGATSAGEPGTAPAAFPAPSSVSGRKFHPFLLLSLIAKPDPHHVLLQV